MAKTYSFLNVSASISGAGGSFQLGSGAGIAEEGISIEPTGDKNIMTIGADGSSMHSLLADKSGTITVRLLKNSPTNSLLRNMFNTQTQNPSLHGNNTIVVRDTGLDTVTTCQQCAFAKKPSEVYSKEGGMVEWVFHSGAIESK